VAGGGDIFDTFTAWVVFATVFIGWPLAIWLKRRGVERRRQRDAENAHFVDIAELMRPDGVFEIPAGAKLISIVIQRGGGGVNNDDR